MKPQILTKSGHYFNFANPENNVFDITDIAHGLSNVCRFGGQCRDFYSVAQHSVAVSYLVPEQDQMAGLLHDASEAFLGDIPKPLKILLPDYQEIEKRVELIIFNQFNLALPLSSSIKHADRIMLATEQRDLMPANDDDWAANSQIYPLKSIIRAISPIEAYHLFLNRYEQLLHQSAK